MRIDQETIEHWLKYDEWSAKEASLIILGFHPEAMRGLNINISSRIDLIPEEYREVAKLFQIFKRADWDQFDIRYYNNKLHPTYFLRMALEKGITIDSLVRNAVNEWRKQQIEINPLAHLEKDEFSLKQQERDSLFKIVIGWAIGIYSYDPSAKRNPRLSEMRRDIEKAGLAIDDDTLRKWLKEAASVLPSSAP
ncbi:hypothetical protein ACSVCE_18910 [Chromobacterium haemolyticum]|uniref:hypothetical protein n=1 Tax=Chromobacterium haemolyticum TaxID=394935 RepID=UPI0040553A8E